MKAKVFDFIRADELGYPSWWLLHLQDPGKDFGDRSFLVHNNWVAANGELGPGDEIEFEEDPAGTYSDSEYRFVKGLKRVGKEALVE